MAAMFVVDKGEVVLEFAEEMDNYIQVTVAVMVLMLVVLGNHNLVFWVVREVLVGKMVGELEVLVVVVVEKVMVVVDNHNLVFWVVWEVLGEKMVQELKFLVEKVTVILEVVVDNLVFWFAMVGKMLEVVVNNHMLVF